MAMATLTRQRTGLLVFGCVAVFVGIVLAPDGAGTYRPIETPRFFDRGMIHSSLEAMHGNGVLARLGVRSPSDPVPVLHVVRGETHEQCEAVIAWALYQGYDASDVQVTFGHGGVERYHVELRHQVAANVSAIEGAMSRVMEGVRRLAGTTYHTWMVDNQPKFGRGR